MTDEIAMLRAEIASLRARVEAMVTQEAEADGGVAAQCMAAPLVPIGGGGEAQGAFRWEDGKITNCFFMFGRQVYQAGDVLDATADGTWSLVIPHASPSSATVLRNTDQATGLAQTVVPLFSVSNGEVSVDWRGMPCVPVRE